MKNYIKGTLLIKKSVRDNFRQVNSVNKLLIVTFFQIFSFSNFRKIIGRYAFYEMKLTKTRNFSLTEGQTRFSC